MLCGGRGGGVFIPWVCLKRVFEVILGLTKRGPALWRLPFCLFGGSGPFFAKQQARP